jgi:hypothetical protein
MSSVSTQHILWRSRSSPSARQHSHGSELNANSVNRVWKNGSRVVAVPKVADSEPARARLGSPHPQRALSCRREQLLIGKWINGLEARAPRNVLIVATANKLACIAWAGAVEWRELPCGIEWVGGLEELIEGSPTGSTRRQLGCKNSQTACLRT